MSVGIGPLCYDEKYVVHISNEPDPSLKGDYYFIAKQMGLKYPLLHIAGSQKKIQIFREFMTEHSNASSAKTFETFAQVFKDKSDRKLIFPKLPTMLKSYYKT